MQREISVPISGGNHCKQEFKLIRYNQPNQKNFIDSPAYYHPGDHGPSHFDEVTRMGILNAEPALYSSITPLHTFCLLFNTYFGTEFTLLKDMSYYSEYPRAYPFEVIPNQCQPASA